MEIVTAHEPLIRARAAVLHDLSATGVADAAAVSALEEAVSHREWWLQQWPAGEEFIAGLLAQDVQDALLESRGRWPLCPACPEATHSLHIDPDLGGPDPRWVCEEAGLVIGPLGSL